MTDKDSEVPPELTKLVFHLFLVQLSHTIYALDYVEDRDDITAENFLAHLERTIDDAQSQIARHGIRHTFVQKFVDLLRKSLLEIDLHHLKNWNPKDDEDD